MADTEEQVKKSFFQNAMAWGRKSFPDSRESSPYHKHMFFNIRFMLVQLTWPPENSIPPSLLATLIFPQHARPFQTLPMLFPPVLLFTSYLNLQGYKTDAAGLSAAWSGLYLILAARRKPARLINKFGTRGILRGATMALAGVNMVSGGMAYAFGKREKERGIGE